MTGALLLGACGNDGGAGSTSQSSEATSSDASTGEPTSSSPTTGATTDPTPTTTSGDDGTAGATDPMTTGTTGGEPACAVDADCPQGAGVCQTGVCQAGQCVLVDLPAGTAIGDAPGDCRKDVCDGAGNLEQMPDDADVAPDDFGDCKATVCVAGEPGFVADDLDLPNDDVECTADTCDQGTPKFTAKPVNSFCGAKGEKFCHDDLTCQDCKQVSEACEDESGSEANETQLTAHGLGEITDADASGSFVCAVLDGADDVDWYTFKGNDAILNFVDPTREVISEQNHRICVYITCDNGPPQIGCGGDETEDTAPMGQPGCCGVGNVSPSLNCKGTDDSATIWVKVENVDELACVPYELKYHF
jgi:hypothetical protein